MSNKRRGERRKVSNIGADDEYICCLMCLHASLIVHRAEALRLQV